MLKKLLQVGVVLTSLIALPSWAITINDAGVVGAVDTGTQNQNVGDQIEWSNYLLGLGVNTTITIDANNPVDGATEIYMTGSNDYSGTITDGFRQDGGSLTGWTDFEFVLGKYDGQNAGFVLFNVADYIAASGTSLPALSYSIWGDSNQYQLSHWTGFNATTEVPEPSLVGLLAIGLLGMVAARRRMKV